MKLANNGWRYLGVAVVKPRYPKPSLLLYFQRLQLRYGGLLYTIFFGCLFLLCQRHEYSHAVYDMTDGVYGTVFYSITGLHGIHVFMGLLLLMYTLFRSLHGDFQRSTPHVGASAAVWYWHFVDVVWIFVFVLVYYWGSRGSAPELDTADLSLLISAGPLLPSTGLSLLRSPGGSRFSLSFGFESYSAVYGSDEAVVHSEFCPFAYLWVEVPEKGCVDPQTGIQLRCLSRAPVSKELARRLGLNLQHTSVNPC